MCLKALRDEGQKGTRIVIKARKRPKFFLKNMQIKIFSVPLTDNGELLEELNRFLRSHKVLSVEHHFIPDGMNSAWSFCVKFLNQQSPAATKQYVKTDYKNVLDETTFHKFSQLRAIRKTIGEDNKGQIVTLASG